MGKCIVSAVIILVVISVNQVEPAPEAFKQLTSGFLKVLNDCMSELDIKESVLMDLYHMWKQDYSSLHRETGCVIICMSKKLTLFDLDGKFHHVNTKEFALKNGASEEVANQLVTLAHACDKKVQVTDDECDRALELAKCFRTDIQSIDWDPSMEVVVSEVLTDV
uniref:Pheromone binding protein 2 n=1 Tax=Heortia vitessoides TaxID=1557813 RepID=A0A978W794_9NEOP|nr:pheromone binding protein 2 [Heortia vitessoides]